MTATQRAIEKAIEGGYSGTSFGNGQWLGIRTFQVNGSVESALRIKSILLDPEFWKAVGKVEGWEEECDRCGKQTEDIRKEEAEYSGSVCDRPDGEHKMSPYWKYYMHRMIDALAEGKTPEEYLSTILPTT